MNKKMNAFELTLTSAIVGIILMLALIPQIGFVTILPGVSLTIVHIPVLVGIFILRKLRSAIIFGITFGIGSMIASFIYAASAFDFAFQYPWVSILPRLGFGIAAYYIIVLFGKLATLKQGRLLIFGIVSLVTVFALFYGFRAIATNVGMSPYTSLLGEQATIQNKLTKTNLTQEQIDNYNARLDEIELEIDAAYDKAVARTPKYQQNVAALSLLLSVGFLVLYFAFINKPGSHIQIPSAVVLSTIAHTILVLAAVALFSPSAFVETFGNSQTVIAIVFAIAMSNGLIEALVAALIATPIVQAINSKKESGIDLEKV